MKDYWTRYFVMLFENQNGHHFISFGILGPQQIPETILLR